MDFILVIGIGAILVATGVISPKPKDDEIVVIESVKAASDILAPLDGEIIEINEALSDEPSKVNDDPMGEAWFFKMKPSDPSQVEEYMTEDEYNKLIS